VQLFAQKVNNQGFSTSEIGFWCGCTLVSFLAQIPGLSLVDWLDFSVQLGIDVAPDLSGGLVQFWGAGADGYTLQREVIKFEDVSSSDGNLQVRIFDGLLEVRGNPIKWLSGQNVNGPDDPYLLAQSVYERLSLLLGLPSRFPPPFCVNVSRIDLTQMIEMDSEEDAKNVIGLLAITASKRQSKNATDGLCLYFGKHSRRWAAKMYHKSTELSRNPQRGIDPSQYSHCVRIEFVIRSMHLKDNGWFHLGAWSPALCHQRFLTMFSKLTIPEGQTMIQPPKNMKPKHRLIWREWYSGTNMQAFFNSPRTFYWNRSQMYQYGIDIAKPPYALPGELSKNLVDLVWMRAKSQNYWMANAA
jgi:Phage replication protein CRI